MELPSIPFRSTVDGALGLSPMDLHRLVAAGQLRHPFRGVYCPTELPDTTATRARCAALGLPPHAVICDRSAAWLHGVDCLLPFEIEMRVPALEVVSVQACASRSRGIYAGERALRSDEIMMLDGVRVTTPVRTAIDLASLRGGAQALAVVESFMRSHNLTRFDLQTQLVRHRGRRGVIQARRVVAHASPLSESPGESWTKWFIIEAGLPQPQQQVEIRLPAWGLLRLDFAYPTLRVAVEYDGEAYHGADRRPHDQDRREALERAGWLVIVVRKQDLTAAGRACWISRLQAVLAQRMPLHRRTFPPKIPREH